MSKKKIVKIVQVLLMAMILTLILTGCGIQLFLERINRELESQINTETQRYSEYEANGEYQPRDYEFVGSAEDLDGKVLVIAIFLNDSESYWTSQEKDEVKERIEIAGDFIEESARYYGKDVEIISDEGIYSDLSYECDYYGTVSDFDTLDEYSLDPYQERLLDEIETEIPEEQLMRKYGAEDIAYIGIVSKSGRSYAYPYDEAYGIEYYNECCCIFYTDETYGEVEPPAVYAHELLHLFGAEDLYEGSDVAYNELSVGQYQYIINNYPNEIMYTTYDENGYSVDRWVSNELTDITAYYLGWIDTLPVGFLEAAGYWEVKMFIKLLIWRSCLN